MPHHYTCVSSHLVSMWLITKDQLVHSDCTVLHTQYLDTQKSVSIVMININKYSKWQKYLFLYMQTPKLPNVDSLIRKCAPFGPFFNISNYLFIFDSSRVEDTVQLLEDHSTGSKVYQSLSSTQIHKSCSGEHLKHCFIGFIFIP